MTTVRKASCTLSILAVCMFVPACHHGPRPNDLASGVRNLTRAVQAEAFFSGHEIRDDQLVAEVFTKKPELKAAFDHLKIDVRVFRQDKEVVILVHSPDAKHCWFEDGSWTFYIDRSCYQTRPLPPAQFTLNPPTSTSRPVPASHAASSAAEVP